MAKETYYFSHDSNARNDEKILMLRADYGWEGYGIYWLLIEMMFETEDTQLYHKNIKGIAVANNINRDKLKDIVDTCVKEELFVSDEEVFYSPSLRRRKEKYKNLRQKRSEGGKKAMAKRWGNDKSLITDLQDSNKQDITHDNKGKETKSKSKSKKKEKEDTNTDPCPYSKIINYLNEKTGKSYGYKAKETQKHIKARWNEGYRMEDFVKAIDNSFAHWSKAGDLSNMKPSTLFNGKFGERVTNDAYGWSDKDKNKPMDAKTKRNAEATDYMFEGLD